MLRELGLLEEGARLKALRKIRSAYTGRPDEVLKSRLIEIMRNHFTEEEVMLGRQHSQPNNYFIDLRKAAMKSDFRELLADILANLVANQIRSELARANFIQYDRIIGMKEGNPLVSALVAEKLKLPFALYRGSSFPRFHGSQDPTDLFDGEIEIDENVILIDDSTFRGTTLLNAAISLEALKSKVVGVFLLFEPELATARKSLENRNIQMHSVIVIDKKVIADLRGKS
jgi:orotate phosphoribosyltransferase